MLRTVSISCIFVLFWFGPVSAQELLTLPPELSLTKQSLQLFGLLTILSLAPGIAIMVTCFPFLVTVFSILRQALGLQQAPPNMLLISLALFLTYFIMEPVFVDAYEAGLKPFLEDQISAEIALTQGSIPFQKFMMSRVDETTLVHFLELREIDPLGDKPAPFSVLIPSFMISEISRAFQIGFLIYLPFLIIDMVVAAVLMSMGMMMVPPAAVSLPFKLAFFAVANGWVLISDTLVRGYM